MLEDSPDDITVWLKKLSQEDVASLDHVMALVYQEMRTLARKHMRSERNDHTLCTTGLVNEAYLKLRAQSELKFENRADFFAFASQCMRHILVDYARAQCAEKRGSGQKPIPLESDMIAMSDQQAQEICDIDGAIERLQDLFPRGAQVLQYRLFGGLSLMETAKMIDVSHRTVQRDWISAIAWLRKEVAGPVSLANP